MTKKNRYKILDNIIDLTILICKTNNTEYKITTTKIRGGYLSILHKAIIYEKISTVRMTIEYINIILHNITYGIKLSADDVETLEFLHRFFKKDEYSE